jgi:hypothetical protein
MGIETVPGTSAARVGRTMPALHDPIAENATLSVACGNALATAVAAPAARVAESLADSIGGEAS